jgi:hypothetical protein
LSGVWRYEVPTLALDPSDPDPGGRWKLFAHYYFWAPGRDRMVDYGWIVMRAAAGPAGDWSADVPLFGAGKSPAAPYHNTRVDLNALAPELKNTVAYSEPGALAHEGRLYLSMSALQPHLGVRGISVDHRVFLLVSEDHGKSWRFVSTLLTPDNGLALGCAGFDGSSLASEQGRFFLLAAPMVLQGKTEELDGTAAFEFESLEEGRLRRNLKHQPVVVAFFAPQPSIFSQFGAGQATYDPANTRGGLIMPQFNLGAYPQVFQIFNTGRRIVPVSQESERGARAYPEPAGRL